MSNENDRTRLIILAGLWIFLAVVLLVQAVLVRDYLGNISKLGLRGAPTVSTPLQQPYPAFAADGQTWVRHALSLLEGDSIRLRYTTIDNAPDGREVHWNSAWGWVIAGTGWLRHLFSGETMPLAVERGAIWVGPAVLWLLVAVLSWWAARWAGAAAGVLVAFALVGHARIYEGFFPSYVDHHGLLTVASFVLMLGAVFMGAGWWRASPDGVSSALPASPETARKAAIFSAIGGGFGLWVSAASAIFPIAIVGGAGLATVLIQGRTTRRDGASFDPEVWRIWGRWGAGLSMLFYLVEYAPFNFGLRMEANHPFYALAWLGGGELVALIGAYWLAEPEARRLDWKRLGLATAAVAVAPATIFIGGTAVFVVMDPFLARLHHDYIQEFLPLWKTIQRNGLQSFFSVVSQDNLPLLVGLGLLIVRKRRNPVELWFTTLACLAFTSMAWWQSRWLLNASGPQVCLLLVLLTTILGNAKQLYRWLGVGLAIGIFFVPSMATRYWGGRKDVASHVVSPKDAQSVLLRDIAASLRATQPEGDIVLLTSPNSSTGIGYYGRFKTLGTLYWENNAGLKAAASIFSARTEAEAAKLVRLHHVTHIAMLSESNFLAEYFELLHPGSKMDDIKKSFGYQLLIDKVVPTWLQMIPYKAPDDLIGLNVSVMLFKVSFQQSSAEALYHVALSKVALGDADRAEADFDMLIKQVPAAYEPWLRKGELLMARHDWEGAVRSLIEGIARAPTEQRLILYANYGGMFFRQGHPAQSVAIYQVALAQGFNADIASYLAWVRATSKDDSLRNGKEALTLALQALQTNPNSSTFLNTVAAALAENGRFQEALVAADRAMANARVQNDVAAQRLTEARATAYRANQPWRE